MWRRRLAGFPVAYETLVARMDPDTWYLSRELVPLMPKTPRRPRQCGYVIKRAVDYGLLERAELPTRGRIEFYNPVPHVQLFRALPSFKYRLSRLGAALRDQWRAHFSSALRE
jgi:hypothetical protein